MFIKRFVFLFILILLFSNLAFSGELASKEAINYYNEGVQAQKGLNFEKADTCYTKTLLLDPNDLDLKKFIINNRGIMYAKQGDLDKAEAAFKEAMVMDSSYVPAKLNLGLIYEMRRNRLASLEYWAKIFELDKCKPKGFIIEEGNKNE